MCSRPSPSPQPAAAEARFLGRWFAAARREGLLAALAAEDWQTLTAVLSFTSRDGHRRFTLEQLALALGQSRETAEQRLAQLARSTWQDEPLLQPVAAHDGELVGASLAPLELLARIEPAPAEAESPAPLPETQPAEANDSPLVPELQAVGLEGGQIDWLLDHHPVERIRRQLDWLPARRARNPAALLIRAVQEDWEPPRPHATRNTGGEAK